MVSIDMQHMAFSMTRTKKSSGRSTYRVGAEAQVSVAVFPPDDIIVALWKDYGPGGELKVIERWSNASNNIGVEIPINT